MTRYMSMLRQQITIGSIGKYIISLEINSKFIYFLLTLKVNLFFHEIIKLSSLTVVIFHKIKIKV
jgi:hypothetical protein